MKTTKTLLALGAMALGISAQAHEIYVKPFAISAGGTATIEVYVELSEDVENTPIGVTIQFPEGLTPTSSKGTKNDVIADNSTMYRFNYASTTRKWKIYTTQSYLDEGTYLFSSIEVKANADFTSTNIPLQDWQVGEEKRDSESFNVSVLSNITINPCGYNTFSVSGPVSVSGATVMGATVNGDVLSLSGNGTTVPANTGVILKGEPGATVTFTPAESADAISSDLTPYVVEGTVEANSVLTLMPAEPTFAVYSGTVIPAQKAVLEMNKVSGRIRIVDETNGIENISNDKNIGFIYNLQGQQTQNEKGIVIENGKKAIKL